MSRSVAPVATPGGTVTVATHSLVTSPQLLSHLSQSMNVCGSRPLPSHVGQMTRRGYATFALPPSTDSSRVQRRSAYTSFPGVWPALRSMAFFAPTTSLSHHPFAPLAVSSAAFFTPSPTDSAPFLAFSASFANGFLKATTIGERRDRGLDAVRGLEEDFFDASRSLPSLLSWTRNARGLNGA